MSCHPDTNIKECTPSIQLAILSHWTTTLAFLHEQNTSALTRSHEDRSKWVWQNTDKKSTCSEDDDPCHQLAFPLPPSLQLCKNWTHQKPQLSEKIHASSSEDLQSMTHFKKENDAIWACILKRRESHKKQVRETNDVPPPPSPLLHHTLLKNKKETRAKLIGQETSADNSWCKLHPPAPQHNQ